MNIHSKDDCPLCDGLGFTLQWDKQWVICPICKGRGTIKPKVVPGATGIDYFGDWRR